MSKRTDLGWYGSSDMRLAIEAARATGRQEERERILASMRLPTLMDAPRDYMAGWEAAHDRIERIIGGEPVVVDVDCEDGCGATFPMEFG